MSGSSKESEEYRLHMLRRFEQIDSGPPPSEVAEAEKVIADYRKKQADAREAIVRLRAQLPSPNLCPQCWFMHGQKSSLHAARHDDPDNFDRMKCGLCGHTEDRSVRS